MQLRKKHQGKQKAKVIAGPLIDEKGNLISESLDKYFASVYTIEDTISISQ